MSKATKDYQNIIGEAIEAHFLGLDHIATGGLLPVIEGAGRRLLEEYGIRKVHTVKSIYCELVKFCLSESNKHNITKANEAATLLAEERGCLLNSFVTFCKETLFVGSEKYKLSDNTNRHGISHGLFSTKNMESQLISIRQFQQSIF
jgi:hypothetical protein